MRPALAAFALVALWSASALGADPEKKCEHRVIANTTGYRNARIAVAQTQLHAPSLLADRQIFPYFVNVPGGDLNVTMAMDMGFVPNVARVPTLNETDGPGCEDLPTYSLRDYDIAVNNFALTVLFEWIGLFAGMVTTFGGTAGAPGERGLAGFITPFAFQRFIASPDATERVSERSGSRAKESTFFLGPAVALRYFSLRAAWAPTMLMVSTASPELHLSASATWSQDLETLSYLRAGLDQLPTPAGRTSAYVRQLTWQVSPRTFLDTGAPGDEVPKAARFMTVHAEQLDLLGLLDAGVAVSMTPGVALHQATAGVHTLRFHPIPLSQRAEALRARVGEAKESGGDPDLAGTDFRGRLWGGVAGVPAAPYYDSEAAVVPSAGADVGVSFHLGDKSRNSRVTQVLSLRWNEAETLAQIPFARNVWAVSMNIGLEM
ncbi:MAG: hypothetical protein L6Q84_33900 [Polyangiaceae bacterium]|nr:hypothetical protein [Polyangiaceae bacterium]